MLGTVLLSEKDCYVNSYNIAAEKWNTGDRNTVGLKWNATVEKWNTVAIGNVTLWPLRNGKLNA